MLQGWDYVRYVMIRRLTVSSYPVDMPELVKDVLPEVSSKEGSYDVTGSHDITGSHEINDIIDCFVVRLCTGPMKLEYTQN